MNALVAATRWLNRKLTRVLGIADVAPVDPRAQVTAASKPCPLCGAPLAEHRAETSDGQTFLHHPDGRRTDVMETGR